jgi:hypothetical protein
MKLAHAIVITLGLVACKKSGVDGALDKMEGFKNKVCACKDQACIEGVQKEMGEWMEKNADLKDKKPTAAQEKRGEAIFKDLEACSEKIMKGAGAVTPPEAGSAAPTEAGSAAPAAGSAEGSAAGSAEGSAAGSAAGSATP